VAGRQLHHLHLEPLVEQDVDALAGGLLSRVVLVEVQDDPLGEVLIAVFTLGLVVGAEKLFGL
jgi:hypothetical protein